MVETSERPRAADTDGELEVGIALWNAGRYVEAHEEFEQLWLVEVGPRRHFLRGLVHAAMGFHYVTAGDAESAGSKLASAATLLDGFAGDFLGLDVDGLRHGIAKARVALADADDPAGGDPAPIRIPPLAAAPAAPGCEPHP
jgi:hypothetical protein